MKSHFTVFFFQLASYMTAVSAASPLTKRLVAVGVMFSRGEQLNNSDKNVTLCFIQTSSFRCSDGMDRHRQEWLDYSCSEEVGLGHRCLL